MKLTGQFLPLRLNEVRHWIHPALQDVVYLIAKVGWHLGRTTPGITCRAMFHAYSQSHNHTISNLTHVSTICPGSMWRKRPFFAMLL